MPEISYENSYDQCLYHGGCATAGNSLLLHPGNDVISLAPMAA